MRGRRPSVVGRDFKVHIAVSLWTLCGRPIKAVRTQDFEAPVTDDTCGTCKVMKKREDARRKKLGR